MRETTIAKYRVGRFVEQGKNWWQYLMGFFFTSGTSLDTQKLADLQRRACWVGIAVILQFFNETLRVIVQTIESSHTSTVTLLDPASNIILVILIIGSFVALWMAFHPGQIETRSTSTKMQHVIITRPYPWQRWVCGLCFVAALIGLGASAVSIIHCIMPMQFANDGTVLDTNAAIKLLHGQDPYANPNLGNLYLGKPATVNAEWTTPLREGRFAGMLEYPSNSALQAALQNGLKTMHSQEFETKVSYPALSFISLIPFALFNYFNVLPLYIFCHLLLIFVAWKYARPELRPWILLLAFANVSTWTTTVGETLDMLYICLLTIALLTSHRRGLSVILLGLAIASKQTVWFFLPFYAIMMYWQYGFKEALSRVLSAFGIGIAINLPFILWGPAAWLAGVMAPLADPMFPMGTGLIALSTGHVLPYLPTQVYQILEYSIYALSLVYYWLRCRRAPEAAMLLAVLFLFFAWRSLPSYFYCSAFPLLALLLKKPISQQNARGEDRRKAQDRHKARSLQIPLIAR
jgi:hypothetical protein